MSAAKIKPLLRSSFFFPGLLLFLWVSNFYGTPYSTEHQDNRSSNSFEHSLSEQKVDSDRTVKHTHHVPADSGALSEDEFYEEDNFHFSKGEGDEFFNEGGNGKAGDTIPELEGKNFSDASTSCSALQVYGSIKSCGVYNFNHESEKNGKSHHEGLTSLDSEMNIKVDLKNRNDWKLFASGRILYDAVFDLYNNEHFTDSYRESNEYDLEIGPAYVSGRITDRLDFRLGRQIVVWGKSDNLRLTDVLNPLDRREPGITDIEDLRLPVLMTRLDYFLSNWTFSSNFIHERRFNKMPAYGSEFYDAESPPPPEKKPGKIMEDIETGLSLSGIFHNTDIAVYFAHYYDTNSHTVVENNMGVSEKIARYAEINMYGLALNRCLGNWLLKSEAALFDGIRLSAWEQDGSLQENPHDYRQLGLLGGIEYSGFKDTVVSFETVYRRYLNFNLEAELSGADEQTFQHAFRITRSFFYDTLDTILLGTYFGETCNNGGFLRFTVAYDLTDAIKLTGGIVFYESGNVSTFQNAGDNDRFYLEVKYSF
ncbi:MAG: DUF1302 family protein [Desulfobacteraceae bacterium]